MSEGGPSRPPRVPAGAEARLPPRLVVALALAISFGILIVYVAVTAATQSLIPDHPRLQVAVAQALGLLVPGLVVLAALRSLAVRARAPGRSAPVTLRVVLALAALSLAGSVAAQAAHATWASWLHERGWEWVRFFETQAVEAYGPLFQVDGLGQTIVLVLVVTLVPSVCEELVFRRCLQGLLASALPEAAAIGSAALLFAAFHLDPIGLPGRFFLGVSIGVAYYRTGSLVVAFALHAVHNLIAVTLVVLGGWEASGAELEHVPPEVRIVIAAIGAGALAVWIGALVALPRRTPEGPAPAAEPADGPAWWHADGS